MAPLAIEMGLAQFAPSLMRFFGVGEKNAKIVESVVGIASEVTGAKSGEEALAILQNNSDKRYEFQLKVLEKDQELETMYLQDTADARARDVAMRKITIHNYRADSMYILAIIVIAALVYAVLRSDLDEYAKGIITLVLGRFLGYLDNIYNFEFGTTRGSKNKDDTINKLSEKE